MQRFVSTALVYGFVAGAIAVARPSDARAECGGPGSIAVSPPTIPDGTLGVPYEQTFVGSTYTGFTYEILSGSLPPGLMLAGDTGVLAGTPTIPGEYAFEVRAYLSADCDGTHMYTMSVVVPDGGVWEPDAGPSAPDAGNARADAGPDAGPSEPGGGGCIVGRSANAHPALWLLVLGALVARRRVRRIV